MAQARARAGTGRKADAANPVPADRRATRSAGGGGPEPTAEKVPRKRSRGPRWARWCAIFGAVLMLVSGGALVGTELLLARYDGAVAKADLFGDEENGAAPQPESDIKGPLNILLVGIDPRDSDPNWIPRADSVLIMHVPVGLDRGYLFSLPRDLLVDIPRFKKADYRGGQDKLAHAMFYGARVPGQAKPNAAWGFELLAKTVSNYTGIKRFDAGVIVNFTGFKKIVDAMGGVTMYIDQRVESIHRQPDGKHREPSGTGGEGAAAYRGPRKVYPKGTAHLKGWEALDYVRQRYIKGGDYARQRHQQQFIRAMANQALSKDVVTNPVKLDSVLRAAGQSVVFNGRGHNVIDFGLALRGIGSESIVMVKLPGGSYMPHGGYLGEKLEPIAQDFFAAVTSNTVDQFMAAHAELVNPIK